MLDADPMLDSFILGIRSMSAPHVHVRQTYVRQSLAPDSGYQKWEMIDFFHFYKIEGSGASEVSKIEFLKIEVMPWKFYKSTLSLLH